MTFLKNHYGKIFLILALLAAIGLTIACVIPGSPVLPALLGAGILGTVAAGTLPMQIFVVFCMTAAVSLGAMLSLKGIAQGIHHLFSSIATSIADFCRPTTYSQITDDSELLLPEYRPTPKEEGNFISRHWGKMLLLAALTVGIIAACVAAPYVAPLLGPLIVAASPFAQAFVVGLLGFLAVNLTGLSLIGIGQGFVDFIKKLFCCSKPEDDIASDPYKGYEPIVFREEKPFTLSTSTGVKISLDKEKRIPGNTLFNDTTRFQHEPEPGSNPPSSISYSD